MLEALNLNHVEMAQQSVQWVPSPQNWMGNEDTENFDLFLQVKRDPVRLPEGNLLGRLLEGLPYRSAALRHTEEIRPLGWFMNRIFSFFPC